mmetsp:Transcript_2476/g.3304  ORF Transcript_2476/g.3304 Transcript_2476/m.3304 type:complete len:206 (-) Transcript_2476:71-688(-)
MLHYHHHHHQRHLEHQNRFRLHPLLPLLHLHRIDLILQNRLQQLLLKQQVFLSLPLSKQPLLRFPLKSGRFFSVSLYECGLPEVHQENNHEMNCRNNSLLTASFFLLLLLFPSHLSRKESRSKMSEGEHFFETKIGHLFPKLMVLGYLQTLASVGEKLGELILESVQNLARQDLGMIEREEHLIHQHDQLLSLPFHLLFHLYQCG